MHKIILVFGFIFGVTFAINAVPPKPPIGYRWVLQADFSDEFNGTTLDTKKWHNHYPGWEGRRPARFEPQALNVQNGNLEIKSGILKKPHKGFTMYGGAIVSKSDQAHYGYYECCFKASKIKMSTTFWLSNGKVPFTEKDLCENDKYSQELDIQECVGGGTVHKKFRNGMNCNTHYRYIKCGERKETFISKGAGTFLHSEVSDEFHVYGAWWKNAEEVEFYADNEFFQHVKISKEISDQPFNRPMHVNMVTETYDWQPAPTPEEVTNNTINTAYYNWVRGYKLIPINEKYKHPENGVDIYKPLLEIDWKTNLIFGAEAIDVEFNYAVNANAELIFTIIEGKNKVVQKEQLTVFHGYGRRAFDFPI